jgi:hypothetical protein
MIKVTILLLLAQISFVLSGQDNYTLLTKKVGDFIFEAQQTKIGKQVVCYHHEQTEIIWQETETSQVERIQDINLFDSVFVMTYITKSANYWTAIVKKGKTWSTKTTHYLPSSKDNPINEVLLLNSNTISVNTETDSSVFQYDLAKNSREDRRIITFRKTIGLHKYEVRTIDCVTWVFDYHEGQIDTVTAKHGEMSNVKDIGVFDNRFIMVYENFDYASCVSSIWNGGKWETDFLSKLYDIDTSGESPTTLTILDEKTIRYQRRGETTIAKIDIENKKITQEKE